MLLVVSRDLGSFSEHNVVESREGVRFLGVGMGILFMIFTVLRPLFGVIGISTFSYDFLSSESVFIPVSNLEALQQVSFSVLYQPSNSALESALSTNFVLDLFERIKYFF